MKGTVVMMMVLSGLSFLPPCFPRLYRIIKTEMTWANAQTYCRSKYTDLAMAQNQQELTELSTLLSTFEYMWIGLHADTETWTWSFQNKSYYGAGEAGFRMWAAGKPSLGLSQYKACVSMLKSGEWADVACSSTSPFVCYNDTAGTQTSSSSFIFVNQFLSWTDAQSFCRVHYTDLASVRNQAENDQVKMIIQTDYTWIGLYRDSWRWSDGSPVSVSNWKTGNPSSTTTDICGATNYGQWISYSCTTVRWIVCFLAETRKQVVQVVLKADSSLDMEQLKEDMLQKFNFPAMRLRWVEHPDGKVFYRKTKEEDKEEEESCPFR